MLTLLKNLILLPFRLVFGLAHGVIGLVLGILSLVFGLIRGLIGLTVLGVVVAAIAGWFGRRFNGRVW